MGNVVYPDFITKLDIPAHRVLSAAIDAKLESAMVIGWDSDGELYMASSMADGAELLWLLKLVEKRLLEIGDA